MIRAAWAIWLAAALGVAQPAFSETTREVLSFEDLHGWKHDDHAAALRAFTRTCGDLDGPDWRAICAVAKTGPDPRTFFELFFRPVLIEDGSPPLVTGYFEPELHGARRPTARYRFPVYRTPPDLDMRAGELTREAIEARGALAGRGLEIAWVDDATALFFLQVQGSGRIRLTDGTVLRLGYGGTNGLPYRSPGDELVRRGIFTPHQVSARVIGNWVRQNGEAGLALLRGSPNYVFFREIPDLDPDTGPRGAMNRSLTPDRSLAIDPAFVPLGAPVWLEKGGAEPMARLMIAQDTGGAIKGAQRADYFAGSGDEAGQQAAAMKDPGRLVVLLPIPLAFAQAQGGSGG